MKICIWVLSSVLLLGASTGSPAAFGQNNPAEDAGSDAAVTDAAAERQPSDVPTAGNEAELGIGVSSLPPVLTSHLPDVIGKGRGVLVANVSEGSPAAKAGLKKHDVLIRYDDQDLYSPEQLVKRVRNDQPGKQVQLQYVRSGEIATVNVTLGEKERQPPVESNWPGFTGPFDVPLTPLRPDFLTENQDLLGDGTEWTRFQSMSVTKNADGTYQAIVKYQGEKGETVEREYSGTRQEVREAIRADEQLPESQREQLLRSLDDRGRVTLPDLQLPGLRNWNPWTRELFNWPDVTF